GNFFFSSRRRHTRFSRDWSSDVCSSDLAYDKAKSRIEQIDQLMAKIDQTPDPKAIAELQGRLTAEQALIQNEQTKLQMYQMVAKIGRASCRERVYNSRGVRSVTDGKVRI